MRYLKKWEGVVTGSMAGRYDGYPETKYEYYDDIESLARSMGEHAGEEIYELHPVNYSELRKVVDKELEKQKRIEKAQKKKKLQEQMNRLQRELDEL